MRAVLAHGSFSRAGQALGLTQPAVSRQITLLERQAGTQLVRRDRRGAAPTEAGRLLAGHAEVVLDRLALAEEQLAELAGLRRGRVRLGSFFTAFALLTPPWPRSPRPVCRGWPWSTNWSTAGRPSGAWRPGSWTWPSCSSTASSPTRPRPRWSWCRCSPTRPGSCSLPATRWPPGPSWPWPTWPARPGIRAHDESAARLVDHVLEATGLGPPLLLAGHGDEPVEGQVYVVAGDGVALAYALNVIINPAGIAVRPLAGGPIRQVQAAVLRGQRPPGAVALLEMVRELVPPGG
jgi:hypothetical protein